MVELDVQIRKWNVEDSSHGLWWFDCRVMLMPVAANMVDVLEQLCFISPLAYGCSAQMSEL